MKHLFVLLLAFVSMLSCSDANKSKSQSPQEIPLETGDSLRYDREKHLKNVRQLTWGGNNAEAYWSFGGDQLIFQSDFADWEVGCDQIFLLDLEKAAPGYLPPMISTGKGRTTCAYFMPGDSSIVYASTHLADDGCPEVPPRGAKYVWPIYAGYDIFIADLQGQISKRLTDFEGYDAEATVSPVGDKIIFTSLRTGDLELFVMDIDGSNVVQITDELGYDGGAFFSPDGSKIVWRASRPTELEAQEEYKSLLAQGLVEPTDMELYVANADGTDKRKITELGNANWAPFFHPSGKKLIFSTNHNSTRGFPFNLFMINLDGSGMEQITFDDTFDSFPMFSPDGTKLVWASNRFNGGNRDTNLFIADWVD